MNQNNDLTLIEAQSMYMATTRRLADKTKDSYTSDVLQLISFLRSKGIPPTINISVDWFEKYLLHLEQSGMSVQTICRRFYSYKSLYKFLVKRSIMSENPIDAIELPKRIKTSREVYLNEHELAALLNSITLFPPHQRYNVGVVLETLVFTGVRNEESSNIKIEHIDTSLRKLFILGKGNKPRNIPICNRLFSVYQYALNDARLLPDQSLLHGISGRPIKRQSLEDIVDKACRLAKIQKHVTPHTLRHSLASLLPKYGAIRPDIKLLLGHGNMDTTDLYSHSELEQVRRILDVFASTISHLQQNVSQTSTYQPFGTLVPYAIQEPKTFGYVQTPNHFSQNQVQYDVPAWLKRHAI